MSIHHSISAVLEWDKVTVFGGLHFFSQIVEKSRPKFTAASQNQFNSDADSLKYSSLLVNAECTHEII